MPLAAELFLTLNGHDLRAEDADCVMTWRALADGSLSESELAGWLRKWGRPQE